MTSIIRKFHSFIIDCPVTCDLFLLTFAYTLSHGMMLFNRGVFWDDWVLYNMNTTLIIDRFKQAGVFWGGYLHVFISAEGVIAYRVVTFTSFLLAAWCFWAVLKDLNVDRYSRIFVGIFFAIFPVNSARIAMINMPSAFCYALFFFGFWLTLRYMQTRSFWYRVIALSLLFVSFTINALLVFYVFIVLYIMYRERPEPKSFSGWIHLGPRYADYLLLPILFWFIKIVYMKPYGLYAGYNQISSGSLINAITNSFYIFNTSFFAVIAHAVVVMPFFQKVSSIYPAILIGSAVIILFLLYRILFDKNEHKMRDSLYLFLLGAFAFLLAAFPYVVVNKIPGLPDWDSRHQLLLPLGSALLLVYGVRLLSQKRVVTLPIYLLLMIMFVHATMLDNLSFQRDWFKQLSLIENFRASSYIRNSTSFLFNDKTRNLDANQRLYSFYEYTGLMKKAFGDERRFGHDLSTYSGLRSIEPYMSSYYNLGDFKKKEPDKIVEINYGTLSLNDTEVLKMMLLEYVDKPSFRSNVLNVISLNVQQRL